MARIEPNYGSNYWARRTIRNIGRGVSGRIGQTVVRPGGTVAAMGTAVYYLEKRYDVIPEGHRYRNLAICAAGAVAAGAAVLHVLAPAILWLAGKMENVEVPPSIRDIRLLRKAFKGLSRDLGDLHQFRTDLEMAATRTPGLAHTAALLSAAIAGGNYLEARDILNTNLTPADVETHNRSLAGDLAKESYGLDPKRYYRALYLSTLKSASVSICHDLGRNNSHIGTVLDETLAILDKKELNGIVNFSGRFRALMGRATEAAWGLSRVAATPAAVVAPAAATPTTPSTPPPTATPPGVPSVPPPPAPPAPAPFPSRFGRRGGP